MRTLLHPWPSALRRRVARQENLLLLLDFDGTLSPIAPRPQSARMAADLRRLLRRLTNRPRLHVGVISGRALADVKRRVGVPALYYGGNHGMEVKGPGLRFLHPKALRLKPALEQVAEVCRKAFSGIPGALVEAKGLGVAVHDRRVPPDALDLFERTLRRVKQSTRGLPLVWQVGRRVWEALPRIGWDKGRAALMLRRHLRGPFTIAVGDDATDEHLFRAANRGGVSVRVAPAGPSAAQYAVPRQREVAHILKTLDDVVR